MAPFRCSGLQQGTELRTCVFSRSTSQEKALGTFDGKCVWCNPSRMETVCATPQLKKLLVYNLRVLSIMDHAMTTRMACMRIPEEYRAEIVLAATGRDVGHYESQIGAAVTPPATPPAAAEELMEGEGMAPADEPLGIEEPSESHDEADAASDDGSLGLVPSVYAESEPETDVDIQQEMDAAVALMVPAPSVVDAAQHEGPALPPKRRRLREKNHPTDAAMLDTVLDNPRQDLSRHPQPWKKAPR